jgi:hypothetical protein
MSFNPDKCEVIRITNKKKIIDAKYAIHDQVLHETNRAKYLGVTIDNGPTQWPRILAVVLLMSYSMLI